jgi:ubiquinone/menaquinone biosynthesis C-methylase UbiE
MRRDTLFEVDRDGLRANFNRYTRRAFELLPVLQDPKILDIGCGSGVPTMELARLSSGEIVGIDIDEAALNEFNERINEAHLSDRVKTIKCSLFEIDFPDETFDIVWAEGVIALIGFERGLREWHRLIKPGRFLVVHDNIDEIERKHELIPICGYILIDMFVVPKDVWWNEYYGILENKVKTLQKKHSNDPETVALLEKEQKEIEEFKNNPMYHGSVFFVMQKTDS